MTLVPADPVKTRALRLGVSMSLTGPGELDWTPVRKALSLWPDHLGDRLLAVDFQDDRADPDHAAALAERMIGDGCHALVQFSLSGPAFAVARLAHRYRVPHLALSPIALPVHEADWTFRLSPTAGLMAGGLLDHARAQGYRRLGFVGTDDNYGRSWQTEVEVGAASRGLRVIARDHYARGDADLPGAATLASAKPDAILIAGPGNTAPMPQVALRQAGYAGPVLQTFGADMRALAAQDPALFDGTILPTGPGSAPARLPKNHPSRALIADFEARYRARHGEAPRSQAAIATDDALRVLRAAAEALPGDVADPEAVRTALRTALFHQAIPAGSGIFRYAKADRFGLGPEALILLQLEGHEWHGL